MSSGKLRKNAIDEVADVFIYLIAFCNENDIDIKQAIDQKMKKNKKLSIPIALHYIDRTKQSKAGPCKIQSNSKL